MSKAHQFTSATAPRQGGKRGRKNKLGLEAIKFLEDLYRDYRTHGATAITTMRIERPEQYIRLMADVSTKLVAPDAESVPPVLMVKWLSSPPLPSPADKIPQLIDLQPEAGGDDSPERTVTRDPTPS